MIEGLVGLILLVLTIWAVINILSSGPLLWPRFFGHYLSLLSKLSDLSSGSLSDQNQAAK